MTSRLLARPIALATAASLLVSSVGRVALAAPQGAEAGASMNADEARADAQKRLDEGLKRYSKGDFEGARLAFAQAYAVLTSIDLLYNLMRAEVKSGHPLEALVHIRQLLRDPKATTEDRAKAQRLLEEASRVTGHVAVEAPEGAEVVLDDVPSGEAPIKEPYDVTPGKHKVAAKAPNGTQRTITLDAPAGQVVTARFALDMGRPPVVSAPVPVPGTEQPATTTPSSPPEPTEPEHHGSNARIIAPAVIGGLGVIALGVGIGLGAASQSKQSDAATFRASNPQGFCANQASSACLSYQSILNAQQSDTNTSRVMFAMGGVLVAAAVVTYFVMPGEKKKERSAWIAPTLGGVVAGGQF
jgi:hypothetical protein